MPQSMTDIKLENIYVGSIFRVEEEHDSASSRLDPRAVRLMDRLHFCLQGEDGFRSRLSWVPFLDCSSAVCCPKIDG